MGPRGVKQTWCDTLQVELRQETSHRPMDLRAARPQVYSRPQQAPQGGPAQQEQEWEVALKIASTIASEARAAVKVVCIMA